MHKEALGEFEATQRLSDLHDEITLPTRWTVRWRVEAVRPIRRLLAQKQIKRSVKLNPGTPCVTNILEILFRSF